MNGMQDWKSKQDQVWNDFFKVLLTNFGLSHPRAGIALKERINVELEQTRGQLLDIDSETRSQTSKISTLNISQNQHKKRKEHLIETLNKLTS